MGRSARIANILCASILALGKKLFFADRPSRKRIAARTGRESPEFECESERRRDSHKSGQVLQKLVLFAFRFARIDSRESSKRWCTNRLPTKVRRGAKKCGKVLRRFCPLVVALYDLRYRPKGVSEKASAIARMRQTCVRNASKMRQKYVKMGLVLL